MAKVSIIIPTKNRSEILARCLKYLTCQETKVDFEVLVVDNGSNPNEKKKNKSMVDMLKFGVWLEKAGNGPAVARNYAIKQAKGEILIFINDDTIVNSHFVENHYGFHWKHGGCDVGLVGKFEEHPDLTGDGVMKWLVNESKMHFQYRVRNNKVIDWWYFWTCNLSVKREFMVENKLWFDQSFPTAAWEDIELGYRAYKKGLKLYFCDNIGAYHWHTFTIGDLVARFYSHGRGLFHLAETMPKNVLPPLGKRYVRSFMSIVLGIIGYDWWRGYYINYLDKTKKINNLFQLEIVYQKLKGFEYEKERNNTNISGN